MRWQGAVGAKRVEERRRLPSRHQIWPAPSSVVPLRCPAPAPPSPVARPMQPLPLGAGGDPSRQPDARGGEGPSDEPGRRARGGGIAERDAPRTCRRRPPTGLAVGERARTHLGSRDHAGSCSITGTRDGVLSSVDSSAGESIRTSASQKSSRLSAVRPSALCSSGAASPEHSAASTSLLDISRMDSLAGEAFLEVTRVSASASASSSRLLFIAPATPCEKANDADASRRGALARCRGRVGDIR